MKITRVGITPVFVPVDQPLVHAHGAHQGFHRIVVEIETDDGRIGLGECYGGKAREAQLLEFAETLIGQDPTAYEAMRWRYGSATMQKLFAHTLPYAAIEFACLDLQGQALGVPVSTLLGGVMRERIDTTAYVFYRHAGGDGLPAVDSVDEVVAYTQRLIDTHGFKTIKFKNGVKDVDTEIETVRALRAAFPKLRLRIDPNAVWSVTTSVRVARSLQDCDLEYLEDPTWGMRAMARVGAKTPWLTLASNMTIFGLEDLVPAAMMDVVDIALLDPHWYGGMRQTRLAAQICQSFGVDVGMHSGGELGISLAAMLHTAAATPNLVVAMDAHYHHLSDDVITEPFVYRDGAIAVPTTPGLGVALDRDKLAHYAELASRAEAETWNDDAADPSRIPYYPRW